jgi:hypothetical protein
MIKKCKELGLGDSYIISYSRSCVLIWKQEIIFEQNVETQEQICRCAFGKTQNSCTYIDGRVMSETSSEYIDVELNLTGLPCLSDFRAINDYNRWAVKCM